MDTNPAYSRLTCRECGSAFRPSNVTHRCPDCGGILDPTYSLDRIDLTREDIETRRFDSMWRYEELLPFPRSNAVTMDEGTTPLVECPSLAAEMGVERVLIKDEGRNPTGTFKDRGQTVAMTAARSSGAESIALASAGNAGQSAAAYAGRGELGAHVFLPSRAGFTQKAMVNVHGATLTVVDGAIGDAAAEYRAEMSAHDDWFSVQTFETPYRHEGKKTMFYEIAEQLDWKAPDSIVYPTGGGVGLIGMHKGAREFHTLDLIDDVPSFYAAQSTGCAPIVRSLEDGANKHEPWQDPDTICGGIEIPDPGASEWILEAVRESGGGGVATSDEEILEAGVAIAQKTGLEMGVTAAAAASGAWKLAEQGEFAADETVVILNTGGGTKDADILRSHLMRKGV